MQRAQLPLKLAGGRRARHVGKEAPGTIVVAPDAVPTTIRVLGYGPDANDEVDDISPSALREFGERHAVTWVDVVGLGDAEIIAAMGDAFGLHPLALEDVAHPHERGKVEEYEHHTFIVARMATHRGAEVQIEQFSMFIGDRWVLTFQERQGDCLDPVRERIRAGRGRIRRSAADFLAYAVLDALTDEFFPILDEFVDVFDGLETRIIEGEDKGVLNDLYAARQAIAPVRRAIAPLRGVVRFLQVESSVVSDATKIYLRDVSDHLHTIEEEVEHLREWSATLMDVHYTVVSNKLNEVMRVLTVIATVFMPLGFVASLYGMNFDRSSPYNMPELGWTFGYLFVWCVMLGIVGTMILYFRRKGWF